MVISSALYAQMMSLLTGYIDGLQAADAWKVRKVKSAFVPGPNLVFADITIDTEWTLNGATWPPAWSIGRNALTSGYKFCNMISQRVDISTTSNVRTVYGVVAVGSVSNTVYASALLPNSINISQNGQMISLPEPSLELPMNAVT